MKKKHLLIAVCCFILFALTASAQESEAAKAFRARNDSLISAWKKEHEEQSRLRRTAFLTHIDTIASDSLTVLSARNMELQTLPDLSRFERLKQIRLEGHALGKLSKSTFRADSLTHIIIGRSELEKIHFPVNRSVKVLSLHQNHLKRVPRSIGKLKNLQSLNLENNSIKRIPRFLKRMDSLKDINLNHNNIQLSKRAVRRLAYIEAVSLGGNKIDVLPENTGKMQGLKTLNLGKNQLHELPPSFAELKGLEQLIFYENNFSEFPVEVLELPHLKHIDFYYNQLTSLPEALGELSELEQLFLSFNQIQALPNSLENLENLTYLYVHNNRLVVVPNWIGQHQKLQRLGFNNNKIINLPDFSAMPALTDLDLQENLIEKFPWELLEKEGMQLLLLKNNEFRLGKDEKEMLTKTIEQLKKRGFVVVL